MRDIILLVYLVAVSLAFEECGLKGTDRRRSRSSDEVGKRQTIYGPLGQTAGHGEFPWQVLIAKSRSKTSTRWKFVCGGTLIAKNWVLTAAHCFENGEERVPSDFFVILGKWSLISADGTEQAITAMKIVLHKDYNDDSMRNDIALIQLAKNADCSSEYVGTACLPIPGDNYQDGKNCWASGWVWLKTYPVDPHPRPNKLQKLKGNIQRPFFLQKSWPGEIYPGMIGFMTGVDWKDWIDNPDSMGQSSSFEEGDSGGPLVCPSKSKPNKYDVVGIISWGPIIGNRERESRSTVLTSVTYFRNWIKFNMDQYVNRYDYDVVSNNFANDEASVK